MKAAGVKRLITVTGFGAGDSRGHGGFGYDWIVFPLLLKRVYDDKDVQEWIVRLSGLGRVTSHTQDGRRYREANSLIPGEGKKCPGNSPSD